MFNLKARMEFAKQIPRLLATIAVFAGGSASLNSDVRAQLSDTYVEARTAVDAWFEARADAGAGVDGDASSVNAAADTAAYGQAGLAAASSHGDDGDCGKDLDVSAEAQLDAQAGADLAASNEGDSQAGASAALGLESWAEAR
jgi:hypothetical protein